MKKILSKIIEYELGVPSKRDEYQQNVLYESGFIAFGSYFIFSFIEFLVAGCIFLNSSSENFLYNLLAVILLINLLAMSVTLAFLKYKVRKSKIDLIDVTNEQSYETLVKKAKRRGVNCGILFFVLEKAIVIFGGPNNAGNTIAERVLSPWNNVMLLVFAVICGFAVYITLKNKIQK
ncbi:DUF3278 domain-containing protein [Apilactobacillus apinorum]|uniref:DUF3278 domain-containing protein n=1 Tax=Apilactobacillus apinorum TaxID=1218495 RepID=UPI0006B4C123|nr:DUF3278 domain-containing protein [Apilactobacillus apinorum]KOY68162.1 hypothetical protein RZ74_12200 [Apilactobacillus apinorum]CAI2692906.1 Hypothetical protein AAPFHON13_13200 [Apilactobacillus apinorum]